MTLRDFPLSVFGKRLHPLVPPTPCPPVLTHPPPTCTHPHAPSPTCPISPVRLQREEDSDFSYAIQLMIARTLSRKLESARKETRMLRA